MEISKVLIVTTILFLSTILVTTTTTSSSAYAHYYSEQQRFNSGWYAALSYCGAPQSVIDGYIASVDYQGHTELYHSGFLKGLNQCSQQDQSQAEISPNDPTTPHSVEVNHNHYYDPSLQPQQQQQQQQTDTSQNQITSQGQVNKPTIICVVSIGTCPVTNGQTQYSSNPAVSDNNNNDN